MGKKRIIQLSLVLLIFVLSYTVFYLYFYESDKVKLTVNQNLQKKQIIESTEVDNIIENLEYKSIDTEGNQYMLKSKSANQSQENKNILFLSEVEAVINLLGREPIYINSNYAEYNKINYDTKFYDEVEVKYNDNNLNANNLDLSIRSNKAYIYNNILFANKNSSVEADVIDFNLLSGDININMFEEKDKIKIINK